MKKGLVSIIMPVYGVEQYIGKAIESVLCQTYQNWELLVVNDGSKDCSSEIAKQYASSDSRIKIFDKNNGGLSDARNFGLARTNGEFIHFFDSDDWLENDFYLRHLEALQDNADLVISGYYVDYFDTNLKHISCTARRCMGQKYPFDNADSQIDKVSGFLYFAWNKLYRSDFLKRDKLFFKKGLCRVEDNEFFSRVVQCKPKIIFIPYLGYHYAVRQRKTLSNYYDIAILDDMTVGFRCSKLIFKTMGCSQVKLQELLYQCANKSIRSYLNLLFQYVSLTRYKQIWRGIQSLKMASDIKNCLTFYNGKKDIISLLITHNCFFLLCLVYYLRSLKFFLVRCCHQLTTK